MKKWFVASLFVLFIFILGACSIRPGDIVDSKKYRNRNFSDKNMPDVQFIDSDFSKSDFEGANLQNGIFTDSVFMEVNFNNANLENAKLNSTDLTGASFSGADLSGADLSGLVLQDINFEGAIFADANLSEVVFENCNFKNSSFTNSNLRNASFTNSDFQGSEFTGADMQGIVLDGSIFLQSVGIDREMFDSFASYANTQFHSIEEIHTYLADNCDATEWKMDAPPFSGSKASHQYLVVSPDGGVGQYGESNATSIWETDFLVCESNLDEVSKSCTYTGGHVLNLKVETITLSFVMSQSGNEIETTTYNAGPTECPSRWEFDTNNYFATRKYPMEEGFVESAINQFVEKHTGWE